MVADELSRAQREIAARNERQALAIKIWDEARIDAWYEYRNFNILKDPRRVPDHLVEYLNKHNPYRNGDRHVE